MVPSRTVPPHRLREDPEVRPPRSVGERRAVRAIEREPPLDHAPQRGRQRPCLSHQAPQADGQGFVVVIRSQASSVDNGRVSGSGRLARRPLHAMTYGVAVVKKMSVGFAVFPLFVRAKNGRKVLPLWVRPSYSPRKCPRAAGATGAVSMSNEPDVIRCSPLHVAPWSVE